MPATHAILRFCAILQTLRVKLSVSQVKLSQNFGVSRDVFGILHFVSEMNWVSGLPLGGHQWRKTQNLECPSADPGQLLATQHVDRAGNTEWATARHLTRRPVAHLTDDGGRGGDRMTA